MLPTPSTSHLSFDNIYEPAEDSFLLLDTLSSPSEISFLQHRFNKSTSTYDHYSPTVLEIGVGSGVVLAFVTAQAQNIFGRRDVLTIGTDINTFACHGATQTAKTAHGSSPQTSAVLGDIIHADLASPVRSGLVDVLIFNPPYVPTEAAPDLATHYLYNGREEKSGLAQFERDSHLLSMSYAGGADGMEVTNRLLDDLPKLLHPAKGVAYVLLCAQNQPIRVRDRMKALSGFDAELVSSSGKQAGWEKLQILRIWRT